jgi:hypothetical protein
MTDVMTLAGQETIGSAVIVEPSQSLQPFDQQQQQQQQR